MIEHTYSVKWIVLIFRIFVLNGSEPMRESVPQGADWKSDFNLIHIFCRSIFVIKFEWMQDFIFKVFPDLPVTLLERVKVVVEWEHRLKVLVTLIFLGVDLALFNFFFLSDDGLTVSTERIDRLSGFKIRKLRADLEECVVERYWRAFKFFNELLNFIVITLSLSAHLEDRLFDFIEDLKLVGQWRERIKYLFRVGCCALFLWRNSDIEALEEVSEDLMELEETLSVKFLSFLRVYLLQMNLTLPICQFSEMLFDLVDIIGDFIQGNRLF